jgi:2-dehydropantoate 2-reductase
MRILVFGAGVIGSLYAIRLSSVGIDVTLFARGQRLKTLRNKGLLYYEENTLKEVSIKIIDKLENDDIYDYIFVTVRYEQIEGALMDIKDNNSKNILTLSNAVVYDSWIKIIGNKLIPGFPGAGGDIKEDILHAKIGSKNIQGTTFGEINGEKTDRIIEIAKIFETAKIPFEISNDIRAFHITHAAISMANKHFYTENGMVDSTSAKSMKILESIAIDIKSNLICIEKMGISIMPPKMVILKKLPVFVFVLIFYIMLSIKFAKDVLLGNHARNAKNEVLLLNKDFNNLCVKNGIRANIT